MSAKILLVRTGPDVFQAKAYVAVETGLYAREIPSQADLDTSLKSEQFDLVIHDGSKLGKDPLTLAENIRSHQRTAPILLLCAKPEMDVIVRAIRLGVRDLFHPPLNLSAFFARATELLQPRLNGHTTAIAQHCRHEMTLFLAGETRASSSQPFVAVASPASSAELDTLRAECERLEKQLQDEVKRRDAAEREAKAQTERIAERERALAKTESDLAAERARIVNERSSTTNNGADIEKQKKQNEKRAAELAQADQALAPLRAELQAAQAALAEREAALEAEREALAEQRSELEGARAAAAQAKA